MRPAYKYPDTDPPDAVRHDTMVPPTVASARPIFGTRELIREECEALLKMLLEKNAAYGNSALEPVRVFSTSDAEEQIRVRIDDKLSRLMRGSAAGEDVELDLIGYIVLLRVARRMKR